MVRRKHFRRKLRVPGQPDRPSLDEEPDLEDPGELQGEQIVLALTPRAGRGPGSPPPLEEDGGTAYWLAPLGADGSDIVQYPASF